MNDEELSVDFSKQTLQNCFVQNYVVPDYQREYVWEKTQIDQLLSDMYEAYQENPAKQYFVGTVVVYKSRSKLEVIDGQQRLTTFFIMICALRSIYRSEDENDEFLRKLIYSSTMDDNGDTINAYHLELQYTDATGCLEKIFNEKTDSNKEDLTASEKRLFDAYESIRTSLCSEYTGIAELKKFAAFLLRKILFVQIETKDMSDALKIFETINQRGVGLNPMDLLKNMIFMQVERDQFKSLNSKWKMIIDELEANDEQPLRFLRYYIMSKYDTTSEKDGILREDQIYSWLSKNNEQCHYKEKPFNFVDDMISGVKKYVSYLHPIDNSCGNAHLKNISLLAGGSYKQHLVLMLAAHRMDTVSLSIFKQVLESVIYYATISKIKTNVTERQFAQWCPKIREITNKAELETFVSGQLLPVITAWKQDYKPIFLNLGIGNIQQYRIRFILGRIGRYVDVLSQGQGDSAPLNSDYIGNGIEIEHIMPNKCKNPERYGLTEEDYDQYKNKLGNLTLLEKSINASIQDDSYSSKIEAYEKSAFLLTKSISKLENVGKDTAINRTNEKLKSWVEWNAISIIERQEMLFNIGEEIWAIQKKKLFD